MENETEEVIESEIVPVEENDPSKLGAVAVGAFALVGVATGARFVARKLPWSINITRKTKDSETPETPDPTPAVAE